MNISAQDVKKLREMTGAGMMDCKKALVESEGDFNRAIDYLREKGQKVAAKRADRDANEGCVLAKTTGNFGVLVMLSCETDFVATNAEFVAFTQSIIDNATAKRLTAKEDVLAMEIDGRAVADHITDKVGKIGEKIELARYETIEAPAVYGYIHPGNRMAAIIGLNAEGHDELGHNLAMQVVAMRPIALDPESVPQEIKDNELAVAQQKTREELIGKAVDAALKKAGINPNLVDSDDHINSNMTKGWLTQEQADLARKIKVEEAEKKAATLDEKMIQNIANGRLNKYFQETTLVNQEYIMEGKISVQDFIAKESKDLKISDFRRLELGA